MRARWKCLIRELIICIGMGFLMACATAFIVSQVGLPTAGSGMNMIGGVLILMFFAIIGLVVITYYMYKDCVIEEKQHE
jgi:hypothetical protein